MTEIALGMRRMSRHRVEPELPTDARYRRLVKSPHPGLRAALPSGLTAFPEGVVPHTKFVLPATVGVRVLFKIEDSPYRPPEFVAGICSAYSLLEGACSPSYIAGCLDPLAAYTLLGVPGAELCGQLIDLGELIGHRGRELGSRLRDAGEWSCRFELLENFLLQRAHEGCPPDPEVQFAWNRLLRADRQVEINTLATEVGWSHKHLINRFARQVGLTPKVAARLIRFDRARGHLVRHPQTRGADVAAHFGYADHAHLIREFQQFAGTTPAAYATAAGRTAD